MHMRSQLPRARASSQFRLEYCLAMSSGASASVNPSRRAQKADQRTQLYARATSAPDELRQNRVLALLEEKKRKREGEARRAAGLPPLPPLQPPKQEEPPPEPAKQVAPPLPAAGAGSSDDESRRKKQKREKVRAHSARILVALRAPLHRVRLASPPVPACARLRPLRPCSSCGATLDLSHDPAAVCPLPRRRRGRRGRRRRSASGRAALTAATAATRRSTRGRRSTSISTSTSTPKIKSRGLRSYPPMARVVPGISIFVSAWSRCVRALRR